MGMNVNVGEPGDDDEGQESIVAEINITPLTDVFLVLLIIFMVTSTSMIEQDRSSNSSVKVALPKSKAAGPAAEKRNDPILTITKGNELYIFKTRVTADTLEVELRKAIEESGSTNLLIRGDKNVLLGTTVDIMSIATRAGATKISILTEKASGG